MATSDSSKKTEKKVTELKKEISSDINAAEAAINAGKGSKSYIESVAKDRIEIWREAAELDIPEGQWLLGRCLECGFATKKNQSEAMILYHKAAEQKYVNAQYTIAWNYTNGECVDKDPAEATKWYLKAAEQGSMLAQERMAGIHMNNEDYDNAIMWYKKAAKNGCSYSAIQAGLLLLDDSPKESVKMYEKAVALGDIQALPYLGECYLDGNGVEKDQLKGIDYLRKAAKQGDGAGLYKLGICYKEGLGVPKDEDEASSLFKKAKEAGYDMPPQHEELQKEKLVTDVKIEKENLVTDVKIEKENLEEVKNTEKDTIFSQDNIALFFRVNIRTFLAYAIIVYILSTLINSSVQYEGIKLWAYVIVLCLLIRLGHLKIEISNHEAALLLQTRIKEFLPYAIIGCILFALMGYFLFMIFVLILVIIRAIKRNKMQVKEAIEKEKKTVNAQNSSEQSDFDKNLELAKQGDADAQQHVGWCYVNGKGVDKDSIEGVKWYRKAAEQGNNTKKDTIFSKDNIALFFRVNITTFLAYVLIVYILSVLISVSFQYTSLRHTSLRHTISENPPIILTCIIVLFLIIRAMHLIIKKINKIDNKWEHTRLLSKNDKKSMRYNMGCIFPMNIIFFPIGVPITLLMQISMQSKGNKSGDKLKQMMDSPDYFYTSMVSAIGVNVTNKKIAITSNHKAINNNIDYEFSLDKIRAYRAYAPGHTTWETAPGNHSAFDRRDTILKNVQNQQNAIIKTGLHFEIDDIRMPVVMAQMGYEEAEKWMLVIEKLLNGNLEIQSKPLFYPVNNDPNRIKLRDV